MIAYQLVQPTGIEGSDNRGHASVSEFPASRSFLSALNSSLPRSELVADVAAAEVQHLERGQLAQRRGHALAMCTAVGPLSSYERSFALLCHKSGNSCTWRMWERWLLHWQAWVSCGTVWRLRHGRSCLCASARALCLVLRCTAERIAGTEICRARDPTPNPMRILRVTVSLAPAAGSRFGTLFYSCTTLRVRPVDLGYAVACRNAITSRTHVGIFSIPAPAWRGTFASP